MRTAQAAESLYGFFAPPDFAESVLKKYWGAVYFLIQVGCLQWNKPLES